MIVFTVSNQVNVPNAFLDLRRALAETVSRRERQTQCNEYKVVSESAVCHRVFTISVESLIWYGLVFRVDSSAVKRIVVVRRSDFSSNDKSELQLAASQCGQVRLAMAEGESFHGSAILQSGRACFIFRLEHPMAACRKPVRSGLPDRSRPLKITARFSGQKRSVAATACSEDCGVTCSVRQA